MSHWLPVLVQTPAHAAIGSLLTYRSECALPSGTLVRVPLGQRETLGLVWREDAAQSGAELADGKIRSISAVLQGLAPLDNAWLDLVAFAAQYYQRSLGEVALGALPAQLRDLNLEQWERRLKRMRKGTQASASAQVQDTVAAHAATTPDTPPEPSAEQSAALHAIAGHSGPFLLFGSTGSGKTEVYLRCVQELLQTRPHAQALVLVPEINLTPQLEERFAARFAPQHGPHAVVSLHSGMTHAQRLSSWLAAHSGQARIVLGTRMAVFASMPHLGLIVVDEEHDPSYKSGEGARYSARDLAVYRGRLQGAKVLLGSATPSMESWHHSRAREEGGRYERLHMPSRVGQESALPQVRLVDMNHQPRHTVISDVLLRAMGERIARGEQSLVFLNRRGYAPVLHCPQCDWKSQCPHCSAYRVFHKIDRTLRCHHCGYTERVPRACPSCGNPDIAPLGRGTERIEELLAHLLQDLRRPDGQGVRVARIDADTTRAKGALQTQLAAVHAGEVDVLVGTQMVAKGHDFRRITLVAAINPDSALFSCDYRAPERLFSLLMQAAGRAGRDAALGAASEMWVQTFAPTHPLYRALKRHDYPLFASTQLQEREQSGLPPFSAQALLRAEGRSQDQAQAFLNAARQAALHAIETEADWAAFASHITLYPAVPMSVQRVANVERAQLLIESPSRAALQQFLHLWQDLLHTTRQGPHGKGLIRWAIDVDPLSI